MPPRRPLHPVTSAAASTAVLFVAVLLGGCASASSRTESPPAAPVTPAVEGGSAAERAAAAGIAPDLVFTTEVDGYDLAPQSVGPAETEGMSATWFNETTAAMLSIRTDRGELTAAGCSAIPLWDVPDEPVTCTEEDGVWHRSGGGVHEYIAVREGARIRVIGANAPSEDLAAAAKAVRVPSAEELEHLFSALPEVPAGPVERGDMPENGDGAPVDPVGPGG